MLLIILMSNSEIALRQKSQNAMDDKSTLVRVGLGAVNKYTIIWANYGPVFCHHMVSVVTMNELPFVFRMLFGMWLIIHAGITVNLCQWKTPIMHRISHLWRLISSRKYGNLILKYIEKSFQFCKACLWQTCNMSFNFLPQELLVLMMDDKIRFSNCPLIRDMSTFSQNSEFINKVCYWARLCY